MKKIFAIILSMALCPVFTVSAAENLFGKNPEKLIIVNEDVSDFAVSRVDEGISIANLTSWADKYANTNVGAIFLNTNATRTNYSSNIIETYWDGIDKTENSWNKAYYDAHMSGIDFNKVRIDLLREREISPWISIRMNDIHDATGGGMSSVFKMMHNYEIREKSGYDAWYYSLDYAIKEVRDYYFALIRENIERYDVDGIELDWMRESYAIKDDEYRELTTQAINELTGDIRRLLDQWEIKRGHEIKLAVRVPAQIHVAENYALDAKTWSENKWVDMVTVTARWATSDTDMDIEGWEKLLKETANNPDIIVGAGQEIIYRSNPSMTIQHQGIDTIRGTSYSYLSRGSDYIYLFNNMDRRTAIYNAANDYIPMLQQINSLENMDGFLRRHAVTFRDRWASYETATYALPAVVSSSESQSFRIHIGDIKEENDTEAYVVLGINQNYGGTDAGAISDSTNNIVKLNDIECVYAGKLSGINNPYPVGGDGTVYDLIRYKIPDSALLDGYNNVTVECADGTQRELTWVEIMVDSVKSGTRNVAYLKEATASSYYGNYASYSPARAVDGNVDNNGWIPSDSDITSSWWKVDLVNEYEISRIEIVARQESGQEWDGYRSNFKVEGSTNADFSEGTVVEFAKTEAFANTVVPAGGTWIINVPEELTQKVQYIRVIELDNESTQTTAPFLTEVRVYSR